MNKLRIYLAASRPRTLTASAGPVLVGMAIAASTVHGVQPLPGIFVLITAVLLQISANLINDYFDHVNNIDTADRLGPARATASGLLTMNEIRRAYRTTLAVALVTGMYLVYRGGVPIMAIGLCCALFAYLYTAGPYPLSYMGLGELLAFTFFGPVAVWGTYYVLTKDTSPFPMLVGIGPGFIASSLMGVNNMRDQASDKKSGKKTLAVRFGEQLSRVIPLLGIIGSILLAGYLTAHRSNPLFLLATFSCTLFLNDWNRILQAPIDRNQNKSLAATGKYLLLYCIALSVGLMT